MTDNHDDGGRDATGPPPGREHAIVLGAGIAGMMTARVLADSYRRVTILERDVLPAGEHRRGAAQGRHLHGLMERGRQIMETLYPGMTAELVERGAPQTELLATTRWYLSGLRARPTATGMIALLPSRPLLESVLRARTAALPGVRVVERVGAVGLVVAGSGRVTGVRVVSSGVPIEDLLAAADLAASGGPTDDRAAAAPAPATASVAALAAGPGSGPVPGPGAPAAPAGIAAPAERAVTITADLVVDATGRGSRAPEWLTQLGFEAPPEERNEVNVGYASRTYRHRPEHLDGDVGVIISTVPGRNRGGVACLIEGGRWHVSLSGMLGDHPPTDPGEFEAFAATLAAPDIHGIITQAEPLDDVVPHRYRGSLRRRYERVDAPPEGFLSIGDAVCSFNPLYAQGMSVAAQQVEALRDCLRSDEPDLPRRFYTRVTPAIDLVWAMSGNADLSHPGVEGNRTARTRLINAYVRRAHVAASRDSAVALAFMRLANLVDTPDILLRPAMMARILRPGARPRPAGAGGGGGAGAGGGAGGGSARRKR
ncbi:FAD-dependent oxidoreductase [Frankia sp. CcI49]|uniref:hypothetical protein n=1 Tax=unclassified Frankia TaxID=2632575 RepID=UPI0006DAD21B|nr:MULTISPECIES: hypothetical protein [unclassified Frankia]KPM56121.1 FAD-dependent oxidoreductase [Frankia sp. R43]ONH49872.1 FAD-dependent oxidoreductase [Frankia sp. CcI49]